MDEQDIEIESRVIRVSQPEFFSRELFPEHPELVEWAKREFKHTGTTLLRRDEELGQRIVADLLLGRTTRQIAAAYRVGRNTIAGIFRELSSRGRVEPMKRRIADLLNECCLLGLEDLASALAQGRISAGQLPVLVGILFDKSLLANGDAAVRIAMERPRGISVEVVRTELLALLAPAAPENKSSATTQEIQ